MYMYVHGREQVMFTSICIHTHSMCMCIYLMQGSDVGFLPMGQSIPACDTSSKVISRLEYHIYRQCVSYDNLGEELLFNAVQDMLNPLNSTKVGIRVCVIA